MDKMTEDERNILQKLDDSLKRPSVVEKIDLIAARVERKLAQTSDSLLAWQPVPLDIYGTVLAEEIRSSWVFIIKAGATSGAERHPNSVQRVMSYRGTGDLQIWDGDGWLSHLLARDFETSLENRWAIVPINVWHQAVVPDNDWVVVSFHTAPAHELIEERPDPNDAKLTRQRRYLDL